MSECTILKFPMPKQEPEQDYEPTPADTMKGIWMSLRYLEEEAIRLGEGDLALLVGMAGMAARDLCRPVETAK